MFYNMCAVVLYVHQAPSTLHCSSLLTDASSVNYQIEELKEAMSRKDQFMSLMSHELRTPLNGIIQLSDSLCRGAGTSQLCNYNVIKPLRM
jgi:signal transduction histidine kinase